MPQDRRPGASAMGQTIAASGPADRDRSAKSSRRSSSTSDNTASDWLLRRIGGPKAVAETLRSLNLDGVDVSRYELEFAADYNGLCCVADMTAVLTGKIRGGGRAVPEAVRARAAKAYESDPRDSATPGGIHHAAGPAAAAGVAERGVHGVAARPDAPDARARRTDPRRAAGGTPAALRPGTSGLTAGVRAAHNDTGIITLPGGRGHLAIAVFLKGAGGTEEARDAAIARIARAAYEWGLSRE